MSTPLDVSWPTNSAIFVTGSLPSGGPAEDLAGSTETWKETVIEAANRWNDTPSTFRISVSDSTGSGNCKAKGDNNLSFSSRVCNNSEFGTNTLAVTAGWSNGKTFVKADILINSNRNWGIYDGSQQHSVEDFRRVVAHELGHAIGIAHSDTRNALMSSTASNIFLPILDDISTLNNIYGTRSHTLTLNNLGAGSISVEPVVYGTGVTSNGKIFTSDYSFLDCNQSSCEITVQDGLRLKLTSIAENGAQFISWSGTQGDTCIHNTTAQIELDGIHEDLILTASYTNSNSTDINSNSFVCKQSSASSKSGGGSINFLLLALLSLYNLRQAPTPTHKKAGY